MEQKIIRVMKKRDDQKLLSDKIQLDDKKREEILSQKTTVELGKIEVRVLRV